MRPIETFLMRAFVDHEFSRSCRVGVRTELRSLCFESLEERRLLSVSLPELISSNPEGLVRGNDESRLAGSSMSSDGRFMAFASLANNLVPDDQNDNWDVFLRDLELNTLTLVSRSRTVEQVTADPINL